MTVKYEFTSNVQKIMIIWVIQTIFCEMLIVGRKMFTPINFLGWPISRIILKMIVWKEQFINQEISYIKKKDKMNYPTVFNYITEILSTKEIKKKWFQVCKKERTPIK